MEAMHNFMEFCQVRIEVKSLDSPFHFVGLDSFADQLDSFAD